MLADFYHYISENKPLDTKGITEIKENKNFLIWQERKSSKMNAFLSEYLLDRIGTNFPLESSFNQLHFIPGDDKRYPIILNLNIIYNDEIKNLLLGFYFSEAQSITFGNNLTWR
ncbi:hypothetical protein ACOI1C_10050 [Bacillus sp. DJP31]|uniref:hypothetical protein n=1 Tax=Bacillus sp. DJP31 TaxID=3409789 RepID=UPI003BB73693